MATSKGPKLVLASGSPRRKDLLAQIGYPFEILESGVAEEEPPGTTPTGVARYFAELKADQVAATGCRDRGIIVAADTVIDLDGRILGKPRSPEDAGRILRELRNRVHRVVTGVCLRRFEDQQRSSFAVTSRVQMRAYTDEEVNRYVGSGEPMDKAGAYAIQGCGGHFVTAVQGCYNNVIGLPLCEVVSSLIALGLPLDPKTVYCRLATGEPCTRLRIRPAVRGAGDR